MDFTGLKKNKSSLLVLLVFILLSIFVFRNYFFKNQVPFPANLLAFFYSPWMDYPIEGYPNGPANKPIGFDVLKLFYPFRQFTVNQLKSGQWPLWNPYNFSGNVHLATYQSAVFYPLNFVYFVLPLIDAWSVLVIIQPVLAGFFMYLFLKEIKLSGRSALFGGLVFAFSGRMIAWMEESLVIEHSFLWLPLILYAIEKIRRQVRPHYLFLLVFSVSCSVLAGFLQMTIYVLVATLTWIIFRFWPVRRQDFKKLGAIILSFIFSFFICSAQLWPAIEAYFNSPRGLVDAKFLFDDYLMPLRHLITFLAPDFWGNPGVYNYFGKLFYHEKVIYLGIPALMMVLFTLFTKTKDTLVRFFKWSSILTLALGFFPLGWLLYYSKLPLLSVMTPSRILFLATFNLSALAAFGIEYYYSSRTNWRPWAMMAIFIGEVFSALLIIVVFGKLLWPDEKYALVSRRNLILPIGLFICSTATVFLPWLANKFALTKRFLNRSKDFAYLGLMLVTTFSFLYFANKFLYFSERKFVFPELPVIAKLQEIAGINRVWGYGHGHLEKNMNIYYGLYSPEGYDALFPEKYGELLYSQNNQGKISSQITRTDADIRPLSDEETILNNHWRKRLLSLLGVKYIVEPKTTKDLWEGWAGIETKPELLKEFKFIWQDDQFKIWEYFEALPRAFLVNSYIVEKDSQKIADLIFDPQFDLSKKIILEEEPEIKIAPASDDNQSKADFLIYSPNRVEIQVKTSNPKLLFLSDNFYPGWLATIDGQKTKILRANFNFRSIAVPRGEHRIIFFYQPKVFYWGLRVSILSLVLFLGWITFVKIKGVR